MTVPAGSITEISGGTEAIRSLTQTCEPDFLVGIVTVDERNPANSCPWIAGG